MNLQSPQEITMQITPENTQNQVAINKNWGIARLGKTKQGGFGLPELAIVVVIAGLIATAAFVVVPRILANFRAAKVVDELNIAIPAIQTAYQNQTSFTGLTTAQVAQNAWVGSSFIEYTAGVPSGKLITQWGTLAFAPVTTGAQGQGTLDNVPSRECIKIGNSFTNDMYLTATINGTKVKSNVNTVDLTAIGTQCSGTVTNTIVFTFGRA